MDIRFYINLYVLEVHWTPYRVISFSIYQIYWSCYHIQLIFLYCVFSLMVLSLHWKKVDSANVSIVFLFMYID